jgi:hypothetical protein
MRMSIEVMRPNDDVSDSSDFSEGSKSESHSSESEASPPTTFRRCQEASCLTYTSKSAAKFTSKPAAKPTSRAKMPVLLGGHVRPISIG